MTATDVAAFVGAITGPLALGWEIYKWWIKGCRLRGSSRPHCTRPGDPALGGMRCIRVNVRNIGDASTTITKGPQSTSTLVSIGSGESGKRNIPRFTALQICLLYLSRAEK
jgi:hypothetical protein